MNIVFIPVRGGSKSIPLKNIKALNGKPLIYWALKASLFCEYADKVYISTDSDEIKEVVKSLIADKELSNFDHKLSIVDRSNDTATDTASTESAMLEFANKYDFDNICLVQATSPLLQAKDLENGFEVFSQENVDSVLSVVKQKRFNWHINNIGYAEAINYDYKKRPRRQEFDGYYVENGAFYITSKENLLKSKNRISGNIKLVEMNECSYYEIDEPDDFLLIESIMKLKRNDISIDKSKIKMVLSDVDGCLTDGGMYYSENGDEIKKFNAKDGMAFRLLKEKGYITGIVTGENVDLNKRRVAKNAQLTEGSPFYCSFVPDGICRRTDSLCGALCRLSLSDLFSCACEGAGLCRRWAQTGSVLRNLSLWIFFSAAGHSANVPGRTSSGISDGTGSLGDFDDPCRSSFMVPH